LQIAVLAKTANEDYKGMMSKIVKGDKGSTKYNWLLRSLRIGSPEEVEKMKSEVEGGERVFLIGDAAHAMPIGTFLASPPPVFHSPPDPRRLTDEAFSLSHLASTPSARRRRKPRNP
jgi:hypothetical protein